MDKLDAMQSFVAVAKTGGFSAAARTLGLPTPTVSRRVAELEAALGARLFERTTRQVVLTDAALPYFHACQRMLDDLRDADAAVTGEHHTPKGELSVTAPVGFGRQHLQPVVMDFLREFPEVDLKLQLVDRVINLVEEHIDVAVRISALPDSSLIARQVGEIRMVILAAPAYLAHHGIPHHPRDLAAHACIAWASLGPFKSWLCAEGGVQTMFPIRVRLTTTLPDSAVDAAIAGLGLVQATSYQAAAAVQAGLLVPVLREYEAPPTPVSLVYPSSRLVPQKLKAFLAHSAPRLSERLQDVARVL